jgi:hypothetical protein
MKLGRNTTAANKNPRCFADWVSGLRPTTTIASGPLRLVRLVGHLEGPDAELLDEGLSSGRTSITEVSATGVVGLVRVTHGGTLPLLLIDGEQIVGAKQNRILNASYLIGSGQGVEVPVSCVERGRWRYTGPSFTSSDTTIGAIARSAKLWRLHRSLDRGDGHNADQQAVWNDVDHYLTRAKISSDTAAFDDAFRKHRPSWEPILSCFEPAPDQVGIAAVAGGVLVGLDLFGSPSLYARGWRKVARGHLAEVYDKREPPSESAALSIALSSIRAIGAGKPASTRAPGIGETLHATNAGITFAAVASGGEIYHAVAASSVDVRPEQ